MSYLSGYSDSVIFVLVCVQDYTLCFSEFMKSALSPSETKTRDFWRTVLSPSTGDYVVADGQWYMCVMCAGGGLVISKTRIAKEAIILCCKNNNR
jgi:hypothetical protein